MCNKKRKQKTKGNAGDAVGNIITLIVGVSIAVLMLIFLGTLAGQTYNVAESDINKIGNTYVTLSSYTFTNDSVTNVGTYVGYKPLRNVNITNLTSGTDVTQYFTINSATGYILPKVQYNNTAVGVTLYYGDLTNQQHIKASITSGFEAQENTGNYLPLIVLGVVVFIVMGLILNYGGMATGRAGGVL